MKALNHYVAQANVMRNIFGQDLFDVNDAASRKAIAERIECDLSPENLCCDGELSGAQVRKRYTQLTNAAKQLMKLDATIKVEV